MVWPMFSLTFCPTMRATTSTPPPGAKGTSNRIGRLGYLAWENASGAKAPMSAKTADAPAMARRRRLIGRLPVLPQLADGKTTAVESLTCRPTPLSSADSALPGQCTTKTESWARRRRSLPHDDIREPSRDLRKHAQDHDRDDHQPHEGHDAPDHVAQRDVGRDVLDDEEIEPDRRVDQPHLHHDRH